MDVGKLKPAEGPANIAILGGNPVIGKALEALLASTDYVARFFAEYPEGDAEPLGGRRLHSSCRPRVAGVKKSS
jgi:hypothetical protein